MAMIHVNRGGTSLGTFSEEDVSEGLRTGRFAGSDLGWREGMAAWQPLSQFAEFVAVIAAAPLGGPPPSITPGVTSSITPSLGGTAAETLAPRSGLPWDQRNQRGIFTAFFETLVMVLIKPGQAFTAMKREGGLGDPLVYALIGGCLGLVVYFVIGLAMPSLLTMGDRNPLGPLAGFGIGMVFVFILLPVFLAIGIFIWSAILHLCLMIVGGAKQSFEATFRVVCFAIGSSYPLIIIPLCGSFISGIWGLVAECIGLSRAHETDIGRAVLAVFLPLIICCGGSFLLIMMLGGMGAMMHQSNP